MEGETAGKPGSVNERSFILSNVLPLLLATYPDRTRTMSFGLYLVLLQVGFALPTLLPVVAVRSYRTFSPSPRMHGSLFSVALAVSSHFPGVTWHSVLRSPDFPPITLGYQRSFSRLSIDILFMIAIRSSNRRDPMHLFPLLMRHPYLLS